MMNCKHCQAELEEGVTVCPECGTDHSEPEMEAVEEVTEEAAVTAEAADEQTAEDISSETSAEEKKTAEIKEGIKATPGRLALAVAAVLVLIAVFVAVIASGLGVFDSGETTEPTVVTDAADATDASQDTVTATAPADTGLNDVTCKGTYTVSDTEAVAARDTVIATLGDQTLTNGQLQAYYWMQVRMFVYQNSYYLSMLGMDYTQPLDVQMLDSLTASYMGSDIYDITWQQYFLQQALSAWQTYGSLICAAEAAGFELSEEDQAYLASMDSSMAADAESNGFETADEMVTYLMGPGAAAEDYKAYDEVYYRSYAYYQDRVNYISELTFTEEELEAYFDENAAMFEAQGITKNSYTVDVRHILIMPEGATSATIRTETFPQEAWDASKAKAESILQQWLAGDKTEESFAALANEHSQDSTDTDYDGVADSGGLYEGVETGTMVANFDAWCFDAARQTGDYDIVETEFGYHIMYFVGKGELLWPDYADYTLRDEMLNNVLTDAAETYPAEVDYKSIVLGFVDLTK